MSPRIRPGTELEYLTWQEAETLFATNPVIVLPVGAQAKEHGPHLPLNNDWLTARYLTQRVLEELPVVALPPLGYAHYPAFVEYPGSVSLRNETFRDTVIDICRSIARHGPKKFYALNNGISTLRGLNEAAETLKTEAIELSYTNLIDATAELERKIVKQVRGTHADEVETSMMLYLAPEVVRMERAVRDDAPETSPGPLTRDPATGKGVFSPSGAWGDPTLATREKGELLTEALVAHIVKGIEEFSA